MSGYLSKLIHIASTDGQNASILNKADFRVDITDALQINTAKRIVLKSVIFPNVFPNIKTGKDDVFKIQENGQPVQNITIPQGFYTASELATSLQTAINLILVAGTVAITFDTKTLKYTFTFTTTTATIFSLSDGNLMAQRLGVVSGAVLTASYTSEAVVSLAGLTEAFLISSVVGRANMARSSGVVINTILNIPINVQYGGVNIYEPQNDEIASIEYPNNTDIRFFDLKLTDRYNEVLDLSNQNLKVCFKVYY